MEAWPMEMKRIEDRLEHRLSRIEDELDSVSQAVKSIGDALLLSQTESESSRADITRMSFYIQAL